MTFRIGRCYKHNTGSMLKIVGACHTTLYGWALMAECAGDRERFIAVGSDEASTANYTEITEEEWMENFNK